MKRVVTYMIFEVDKKIGTIVPVGSTYNVKEDAQKVFNLLSQSTSALLENGTFEDNKMYILTEIAIELDDE